MRKLIFAAVVFSQSLVWADFLSITNGSKLQCGNWGCAKIFVNSQGQFYFTYRGRRFEVSPNVRQSIFEQPDYQGTHIEPHKIAARNYYGSLQTIAPSVVSSATVAAPSLGGGSHRGSFGAKRSYPRRPIAAGRATPVSTTSGASTFSGIAPGTGPGFTCRPTGPVPPTEDIPFDQKLFSTGGRSASNPDVGLGNIRLIGVVDDAAFTPGVLPATEDVYEFSAVKKTVLDRNFPDLTAPRAAGLVMTKNGVRNVLDGKGFLPPSPGGPAFNFAALGYSIEAYGTIDPTTHRRKPVAFSTSVSAVTYPPSPTGNARIDQDRLLKFQGKIGSQDGDQEDDTSSGKLIFVERPGKPFCIIGATLRELPNTVLITAAGGSEYFFGLGPNEFPPRPIRNRLRAQFKVSLQSYENSLIENADKLPCLDDAEVARQLKSLPPGCGDGSRPQLFP